MSTIRIRLYEPKNIDLKKLFIEYFETDTYFQNNFYQSKKDPYKKAVAFYKAKHKTYLHRVIAFLSELYSPTLHDIYGYDGEFSSLDWRQQNEIESAISFEEKHCKVQENWMQPDYRKMLIRFMTDMNLIEVDNSYWSVDSHKQGQKSKGYRIHLRLYSNGMKWKRSNFYIDEGLWDRYKGNISNLRKMSWLNSSPKAYKGIYHHIQNWYLDTDIMPPQIKNKYKKKIELFNSGWKRLQPDSKGKPAFSKKHGGRIYTPFTFLDKNLRKYLRYTPNPDLQYALIDVSNCTFWALAVFATIQREWFTKKELKDFGNFISTIRGNDKDTNINLFNEYLKCNDYNNLVDGLYNNSELSYAIESEYQTVKKLFANSVVPNDALIYIMLSCTGLLYDVMKNHFGIKRQKYKDRIGKALNLGTDILHITYDKYVLHFANQFPSIFELVKEVGNVDDKNYSYRMNNFEVELMLVNYSQTLLDNETPFLNIHDGILMGLEKDLDKDVQIYMHCTLINNKSMDLFGLPIPIKQEKL